VEPLQVLFEDYHCVAVCKPAGLLTQAPPGVPSLEARVKAYLKEKHAKPGNVYLGIPHRLDRPVSGAVIFARNTKAARRLAEEFQQHRVEKVYWAAVTGTVAPPEGTWEDWLRKLADESRTEVVPADTPGARYALLGYRALQPLPRGRTLLELRPMTGRMHQLRAQSGRRGHPILGDAQYGSEELFGPPAAHPRQQLIALHARRLTVKHPTRPDPIDVTASLPPTWADLGVSPDLTGPLTGPLPAAG
jgi:23S rRNA pseudouridine1911/1915/1917 synthase